MTAVRLEDYTLEEIYLAAIKSETEANEIYTRLSSKAGNELLKAKLKRLAENENTHATLLIKMFLNEFPGKPINIPEKSPVPMPGMKDPDSASVYDVLESAKEAEWAAAEFYGAFSELVKDDNEKAITLEIFYTMELGHLRLLEIELDYMRDKSQAMYDLAMTYIDEILDGTSGERKGDEDVM